jgi:hypothetical protein
MNLPRDIREKKALKILYGSQIISVINTEMYLVESESKPDDYYQTSKNTCTCPYHTAYQEPCKHMIAIEFLNEKKIFPMHMEIEQTSDFIQNHAQLKKDYANKLVLDTTKIVTRMAAKKFRDEYETKFKEIKSKLEGRITKLKDEIEDMKEKKKELKLLNMKPKKIVQKPQNCNPKKLTYKDDKYGF